ncbi:MAG TPA: zinc-dependent alcohol dehydrogenase family protein [Arenimonas sp.]|nr:zinc-dependent alcohol dehydrogenase family protein [Arenimonas sp.]
MKRAQYTERGADPQATIEAVEFSLPELVTGQALVQVLAAPINPSDVLTLTGVYGMLPPLPAVGGNEGVGKVIALGPDTKGPPVGQTVLLPVGCGSWSTHIVAEAKTLMTLPNEADPLQLAMMTVNPPTASLMLSEFVKLEAGEWVIQNVANSGVGSYLIQLAKVRGFKTVNIVRRESAVAGVLEIGGDVVLVDGPNLAKSVSEATDGAKIRLAIDAVGGQSTDNLANCLTNGGVLVNYGAMSGQPCQISPASFVFRDVTLKGFWLSHWFKNATHEKRMAVFGEIAMLIATGKLKSRIQATYPIEQIKDAVGAAATGERDGKILIVPNS